MMMNEVQTRPYFKIFICRIFWRRPEICDNLIIFMSHAILSNYYN